MRLIGPPPEDRVAGATSSSALEQFRGSARATPAKSAISFRGTNISYADLEQQADAFGAFLAASGTVAGDRVAICLQNVPEFVVATLGSWIAGACVVPVSPMWKRVELEHLFSDSEPRFVVSTAQHWLDEMAEAASAVGGISPVLLADDVAQSGEWTTWTDALSAGAGKPAPQPAATEMALITYTSGTTGHPKGAINTHLNVAVNAENIATVAELVPADICFAAAPLFHITGLVAEMAVCFARGMTLVLDGRFVPADAAATIERERATYTIAAITAFLALLDSVESGGGDLSSLRSVYSGGAPMMPSVLQRFESATGAYIHNIYGMTETTSATHMVPHGLRSPVDEETGAVSVGVPVPGTSSVILDDDGRELGVGELGEIVSKGPQVIPSYWRNDEATAEAIDQHGMHTGDIGYVDDQGWLYVVDRKKDMINASGYKVWPREVEDALCEHPDVAEAAVIGMPDEYRGETVVAFVVPRAGASVTGEQLIDFAKGRLAAYKYPRQVTLLGQLPKTASGKVMRRELRQ